MAEFHLGFANEETVRDLSLNRREPSWLIAERLGALRKFESLPIEDHLLFTKYVDMSRAKVSETVPYAAPIGKPQAVVTDMAGVSGVFHQHEDSVETLWLDPEIESKGVVFDTLQNAVSRHPEIVKRLVFEHMLLPERDKFAQMSKALWMAGVLLYVPENVTVDKPILFRWSVGRENSALLTRTIVAVGDNSKAAVVEETEAGAMAGGTRQALFGGTTEVILGEGASLKYNSVENLDGGAVAFVNRQAVAGTGSEIHWALGYVGGGMVRSRVDNFLQGKGAAVREVQVLYGNKSQFFDLFSHTRHEAENTVSDLLSKGVLQDQSKAYTKGLITIEKDGKGSDSYLGEFGMVLSRESRFLAIPSLEIENHAVKRAKHASSVAQIDEKQLFYLASRGIPEDEARKMIVMGFLEPVVERIPLESVATRLRNLFERKWGA